MRCDYKIEWADYKSSKYACENWHYSKCIPSSMQKRVSIGLWENNIFQGVLIFGHGANPSIGKPYNLTINECIELTRIALKKGHKTQVSKLIKISIIMLKKENPKLRLIVSYADKGQNHHGGVYQASNWIYEGLSKGVPAIIYNGKEWHAKALKTSFPNIEIKNLKKGKCSDKHKYLFPLDKDIKEFCIKLSKPYPKRVSSVESDISGVHLEEGGAVPTDTLQNIKDEIECPA